MLLLFFAMPMELFSGWGADHRLLPTMLASHLMQRGTYPARDAMAGLRLPM